MSSSDSDDPSIIDPSLERSGQALGEKCGIVAVWTKSKNASIIARRASIALQHRGQESAGIALIDSKGFIKAHVDMGLIARVLTDDIIKSLGPSHQAISHNRYSTTGGSALVNAQPISAKFKTFKIALAHNGNIPNTSNIVSQVKNHPKADSDTAMIAAFLAEKRPQYKTWEETFVNSLAELNGAYSFTALTEDGSIYGIRDPFGIRPLCLGRLADGWIIASESVALDAVGASFVREISRGEILKITPDGELISYFFGEPRRQRICLFEHIYFSRPDSFINSKRIKTLRKESGIRLAKRMKSKGLKPDLVIPIFNSGYFAARGVAEELGVPLVDAIITSTYFGRTFISPGQEMRISAVYGKHAIVPDEIYGKKVVFVDDSLVRSNTSAILAKGLRDAGAKEVYAAIASPPIVNQCDMGIDMRARSDLPASQFEDKPLDVIEEKMGARIGVDDLTYLPLPETTAAMGGDTRDYYCYPFGGDHPIRDKQEVFAKRKNKVSSKIRVVVLTKKETSEIKKLIKKVEKASPNMEVLGVLKEGDSLEKSLEKFKPDLVLNIYWDEILTKGFVENLEQLGTPLFMLTPRLIDKETDSEVFTSRGIIDSSEIKSFSQAYEKGLPVSGVSLYQVLPERQKFGRVVLKEEVRRNGKSLEEWNQVLGDATERTLINGTLRIGHVLEADIEVSKGEFPW